MAWPRLVTGILGTFIANKSKCRFLRKVNIFKWPEVGLGAGGVEKPHHSWLWNDGYTKLREVVKQELLAEWLFVRL